MYYKITPAQLTIYLQLAIRYADKMNDDLPEAKKLCKELMKISWDENAELIITEKPF